MCVCVSAARCVVVAGYKARQRANMCACVCVCVCDRGTESKRESERGSEKESERERERDRVMCTALRRVMLWSCHSVSFMDSRMSH